MPGLVLPRAGDAQPGERRPLVVVNNGSDGATSHMWVHGGAAPERGYHWMTFDGPGQQIMLFEQRHPVPPRLGGRPDAHLDAVITRDDVDTDRIAVIGVSQAGYWVPRALAFEHRFAAAVVDPGVVDVSTSWTAQLPEARCKCSRDQTDEVRPQHADGRALRTTPGSAGVPRWGVRNGPRIPYDALKPSGVRGSATRSSRSPRRCS